VSGRIVELSRIVAHRSEAAAQPEPRNGETAASHQFTFWRGASGQRYVHTVYTLIECPVLPPANYMLVRADAGGRRCILRTGRLEHEAPSLNLAEIRHRGAQLGANEVHVHLLAEDERTRRMVEFDLKSAHGEPSLPGGHTHH
jgi:hypothetical protein